MEIKGNKKIFSGVFLAFTALYVPVMALVDFAIYWIIIHGDRGVIDWTDFIISICIINSLYLGLPLIMFWISYPSPSRRWIFQEDGIQVYGRFGLNKYLPYKDILGLSLMHKGVLSIGIIVDSNKNSKVAGAKIKSIMPYLEKKQVEMVYTHFGRKKTQPAPSSNGDNQPR